jgi:hypothetical protein
MILQLANLHQRKIATFLFTLFYLSIMLPAYAASRNAFPVKVSGEGRFKSVSAQKPIFPSLPAYKSSAGFSSIPHKANRDVEVAPTSPDNNGGESAKNDFIGGPTQPEMSSFKSVSADKLVNLFTGDFSYNIPLIDVGGYPVNLYYDGGVGPEQEASWCGLGWNINPGSINRNVRGVPDDFNGLDTLKQIQKMKPNKTWGFSVGGDAELMGQKGLLDIIQNEWNVKVGATLGVAFNNYLGPSLDLALRGNAGHKIASIAGSEKSAFSASANIGVDINSRSGTSFSGGVSFNANAQKEYNTLSSGLGLATGYNSRSGMKALQVYEQVSFSQYHEKTRGDHTYNAAGYKNANLYSTTISFTKPSYIPSLRMPQTNTAWSGHFQLGLGLYGVEGDVEAEVYGQKSEVADADVELRKPMVGYLYYQNAVNNPSYVMDFTRFNDREVTPSTPVISVPQYSYDVFAIQGEGTGGSIRAYRNDLGYVRDNITTSKDKNFSAGADIAPPGHWGGNVNTVKTPSSIGEWNKGNKLRSSIPFVSSGGTLENVYFRNPGEAAVIDADRYNQVGGTDLVRFVLGGTGQSPTIEPKLQAFDKAGKAQSTLIDLASKPVNAQRNKRTQVVSFLTAEEAAVVGLDKVIKNYNNQTFLDAGSDTLLYESIPKVDGTIRKAHHLSQINVTEGNGRRYVYGLPVYNIVQKDLTFSVDNAYSDIPDTVAITPDLASSNSPLLDDKSSRDGYVQITTTPAYAHSFLLSGILSPDYVDVTGNGITEDDLGTAVKFNYTRIKAGASIAHKWRTPLTSGSAATFNSGNRSEVKDDKGLISYGERESWYLQSVESKTMIALFYLSNRLDGKGAVDQFGGVDNTDNFLKKLDSIQLYSKADLKKNKLAKAKPIKTVHFRYRYLLCQNTPDNPIRTGDSTGKLTLDSLFFTYNGKNRAVKNKYTFYYNSTGANNSADNPDYALAAADRWGTYKPPSLNPDGMKNSDYPYSAQPTTISSKATIDQNASAWMLKKVVLPSGGQIEVSYESDDYAFVQNKRAAVMTPVVGFGSTSAYNLAMSKDKLYSVATEFDYVFIKVPIACTSAMDVYNKYLQGTSQLAFKIWVQMPKGAEYIPCYASFGPAAGVDYGVDALNSDIIWVKMKRLGGKNPLSMTALEYLRQQLPGQAFKGYDVSGEPPLSQVGDMLLGMLLSMRDAFSDPVNAMRNDGKARRTELSKCFVRLNDPDGFKYGGGHRVKSVVLKDNWNTMTKQYTASYGQEYSYVTTENFNGVVRTISSGVASYEPSVGGEENPWQSVLQIEDNLPLGPTSYGAVEMPVLDAFFNAPVVGYSKVTVTSIKNNTDTTKKSRSGIGRQVTEFYTAKDFPVYYSYTPFDAASVKEFHQASTQNFFNKYAYDFKALSQGFLVATNDMHGKLKSQSSYAENDTLTRISYTENFYRNTGVNGLNDKFTFIGKESKGSAYQGNMGIDVELMTDAREFAVKGTSEEYQGQVDVFYIPTPFPFPTLWPVDGISENFYRAVTTTKAISYHAVLDSVVVIEKGSQLSTKNIAYDASTGEVLVSRTNNEFNRPIYSASWPAWWAYSGMGPAYKNMGATYGNVNFSDGKIVSGITSAEVKSVFESGDELLIMNVGTVPASNCPTPSASGVRMLWAFDQNKNPTSLTNTAPDFVFIDGEGKPYTRDAVRFRIVRSGSRNMLDAQAATVTSMVNPLATGKLLTDTSKVINAAAVEFKEKWQTDQDVIKRLKLVFNASTCSFDEVEDSTGAGYLERSINPYKKGLLGNFRSWRSRVFYDNRKEYDTTPGTNLVENGFLKNFKSFWSFNASDNLIPDTLSAQWVWNSVLNKVNAKGLELETMDALGIYTAAQYGYNKTIPLAISSNARYNEGFAENFEDYGYNESINHTLFNTQKRHIDFSVPNGQIISTDNENFKAHTGKYVLKVGNGVTMAVPIPIGGVGDDYSLLFGKDTTKVLNNPGGNYGVSAAPVTVSSLPSHATSSFSVNVLPSDSIYGPTKGHSYTFNDTFYIRIATVGTYNFTMTLGSTGYGFGQSDYVVRNNGFSTAIYDSVGNAVSTSSLSQSGVSTNFGSYTASLCPGIYKVIQTGAELYQGPVAVLNSVNNSYSWTCTNASLTLYKDLSTMSGCPSTKPIGASEAMLNAVFTVPASKSMLVSAWVRENCGDPATGIPCKESTYTNSQVQLLFPGYSAANVTLFPTGPIIDGWQRIEGTFTAPAGATTMSLNLVNNTVSAIYFDDVRIHPFNANMKSYVYDPVNLRLIAELDANNYATFYEYDEEGTLIRTKAETREGIKTITETRSALQKVVK